MIDIEQYWENILMSFKQGIEQIYIQLQQYMGLEYTLGGLN